LAGSALVSTGEAFVEGGEFIGIMPEREDQVTALGGFIAAAEGREIAPARWFRLPGHEENSGRRTKPGLLVGRASGNALAALAERRAELRDFLTRGGGLYLHGLVPERLAALTPLLPAPVSLEKAAPTTPRNPVVKAEPGDPLLWGVSNQDLYWPKPAPRVHWGTPLYEGTVDYVMKTPGTGVAKALTRPASLVRVNVGAGVIVLDTLNWAQAPDYASVRAGRYVSMLLTNLGARFASETKERRHISLKALANSPLPPELARFPIRRKPEGWIVGKPILEYPETVRVGPSGFGLVNPDRNDGRATVRLTAGDRSPVSFRIDGYRDVIELLAVTRGQKSTGPVAELALCLANGARLPFEIVSGRDVRNVTDPPPAGNENAWRGAAPDGKPVAVQAMRFRHPEPWERIERLELAVRGLDDGASLHVIALNAGACREKTPNPGFRPGPAPRGGPSGASAGRWRDVPFFFIGQARHAVFGQEKWLGPEDLSAKVFVGVGQGLLHVMVDVRDDKIRNDARDSGKGTHCQGDCIEIFIDPRPPANLHTPKDNSPYYQIFIVPPTGKHPEATLSFFQPAGLRELPGMAWTASAVEDGYAAELRIPLAAFPDMRGRLGFDVMIDDSDELSRTEKIISWTGLGGQFAAPRKLGVLELE